MPALILNFDRRASSRRSSLLPQRPAHTQLPPRRMRRAFCLAINRTKRKSSWAYLVIAAKRPLYHLSSPHTKTSLQSPSSNTPTNPRHRDQTPNSNHNNEIRPHKPLRLRQRPSLPPRRRREKSRQTTAQNRSQREDPARQSQSPRQERGPES